MHEFQNCLEIYAISSGFLGVIDERNFDLCLDGMCFVISTSNTVITRTNSEQPTGSLL